MAQKKAGGSPIHGNADFTGWATLPVHGTAGADKLTGGGLDDSLYGYGGDDELSGGSRNDRLDGGAGLDEIYGGAGEDLIDGGADADHIYAGSGNDLIRGGVDGDHLDGGADTDTVSYEDVAGGVKVDLAKGTAQSRTDGGSQDTLVGIETIIGSSSGGDTLSGNQAANVIKGLGGSDQLSGQGGSDTLHGGTGGDTLHGGDFANDDTATADALGDGNDLLYGEAGDDWLTGGFGDDTLYGGADNDYQTGGLGRDMLSGGAGDDWLLGGQGADHVDGGSGIDGASYTSSRSGVAVNLSTGVAYEGADVDFLFGIEKVNGGFYGDDLHGDGAANRLNGWGGNDELYGKAGNDVLIGGAGRDRLVGGGGADDLYGNLHDSGHYENVMSGDVFAFLSTSDSTVIGMDVIHDFNRGHIGAPGQPSEPGDRIDLSAIDANTAATGNQAFAFVGDQDFTAAGQVRYHFSGGNTYVAANIGGSLAAEFLLEIEGIVNLNASDFIL